MFKQMNDAKVAPFQTALVLEDPSSRDLLERLARVAASGAPVLITGETGTGKELAAREIHARSGRASKPFIAVNAGAFSEQLIESELFGHEKGAFTGAHERKAGWFEAADGGTLFLDEIGDLPLLLQVKLLRVLSTGEVTRIGSRTPTRVDVRLIAATNVDLASAIRARRFREDLFYRLSVTALALRPLRERLGDILPLARHFLDRYSTRVGRRGMQLADEAEQALLIHDWPGNVRELENKIHQSLIVCAGTEITPADLGLSPVPRSPKSTALLEVPPAEGAEGAWAAFEGALRNLIPYANGDLHARVESALMLAAFHHSGRNQLETARVLGLTRHIARARLIEHGQLPARRARASSRSREPRVVRIGFQNLGLLTLVKAYGVLDAALGKRGLKVSWQEYAGGIQIVDALQRGELDVGVVGDYPAVYAQAEGVPAVYVASEPPSRRGAALIAPRDSAIRSVEELRGKRVVVHRASQAHFLLMLALEEAGLEARDIELIFEPPARALSAFQKGAVDAWSVWDPWLSSVRLDLGARVLRDTAGLFESSVFYLGRQRFAETYPDLIEALREQLYVTARWIESDPGRVTHLVAPGLGMSPRALAASLDRELCGDGIVTPGQVAAQQRVADQCLRLRLIPRPVSVAAAQWPRALAG